MCSPSILFEFPGNALFSQAGNISVLIYRNIYYIWSNITYLYINITEKLLDYSLGSIRHTKGISNNTKVNNMNGLKCLGNMQVALCDDYIYDTQHIF